MTEDSSEDYYPKFDIVQDNYGNKILSGEYMKNISTVLRPGDTIKFVLTASDPYGEELTFTSTLYAGATLVQTSVNTFLVKITKKQ